VAAQRQGEFWSIELERGRRVRARLLVNAAGPWVDDVLSGAIRQSRPHNVRLVQGSHIVVPKLFDDPRAYFFQNADGRIIFAIPYQDRFTLIGTTDRDFAGDPDSVAITPAEIDYLCAAASEYFAHPVEPDHIVWTYSAVRPLFDDGTARAQEATRDYVLKVNDDEALITILGGKITTYRRLAEAVMDKAEHFLGRRGSPWTANAPLPGGDFAADDFAAGIDELQASYPFLTRPLAARLFRLYGTQARTLLGDASTTDHLGKHFGAGLHEREVDYLVKREWALTADDIVWRRTKLGLDMTKAEIVALEAHLLPPQAQERSGS
jgi:glycerol-3-phosphate dehydrogenase